MQTGGGRGDCARLLCEHGLIALAVGSFVLAFDVRRKWNMPQAIHVLVRRVAVKAGKAQGTNAKLTARENFGFEFTVAENNFFADRQFAAWSNQRLPTIWLQFAGQENFHGSGQMLTFGGAGRRLGMNASPLAE